MTFTLRPYQRPPVAAAIQHIKTSIEPIIIDAAPAAGKSFMVAAIADEINKMSGGKKVLCLAPTKELIEQNYEKYLLTGEPASIFSASAGGKSTRHKVVFGSPLTVKNSVSRFLNGYAAVVVDECHGVTPTVRYVIDRMREANENLRVIGLTGTPYRLGTGYIYRIRPDDSIVPENQSTDPYFSKCVYEISAQEMLDAGYITPMVVGSASASGYDTSKLKLNGSGKFDPSAVDQAFVGHGRLTAAIVGDVLEQSASRTGGVMFFAATIQHGEEIMASLSPHNSAFVHGGTDDRAEIIKAYRDGKIRYLVSVGTLTTGFDVPHTSVIAVLRRTESAGLFTQIMGRAWRLFEGKVDSLLLDYADNISMHFPDGDIYNPVIEARPMKKGGFAIDVNCPSCGVVNEFSGRPNDEGYGVSDDGYFLDLIGEKIESEYGPIPAHFGRRCLGMENIGGKYEQCSYRWTSKPCPHCDEPNDIAARYCTTCRGEIIDPNEKLHMEFSKLKRSPFNRQCDVVVGCDVRERVSQSGNEVLRVDFVTPYRSFSIWLQKEPKSTNALRDASLWNRLGGEMPTTIEYKKNENGFFTVFSYNQPEDKDMSL